MLNSRKIFVMYSVVLHPLTQIVESFEIAIGHRRHDQSKTSRISVTCYLSEVLALYEHNNEATNQFHTVMVMYFLQNLKLYFEAFDFCNIPQSNPSSKLLPSKLSFGDATCNFMDLRESAPTKFLSNCERKGLVSPEVSMFSRNITF
jgi:hypothetical protein